MYGFSPAAFDRREPHEHDIYETLEGPWLVAWWERYVAKIEADPRQVYEITQGGLSTGWLMMSQERHDARHAKPVDIIDKMSNDLCRIIDNEIIAKLVEESNRSIVNAMRMPSHYLVPTDQILSATVLRAHEKTLLEFPARSRVASSLRTMNVLV